MITVLRSDKSGGKEAVLLRIPNELMALLDEVIQGDRAPALVKLLEIGLAAHKASGDNIVINVEPPKKTVAPRMIPEEPAALGQDAQMD